MIPLGVREWTKIELSTNLLTSGTGEMRHAFKIVENMPE